MLFNTSGWWSVLHSEALRLDLLPAVEVRRTLSSSKDRGFADHACEIAPITFEDFMHTEKSKIGHDDSEDSQLQPWCEFWGAFLCKISRGYVSIVILGVVACVELWLDL